MVRNTPRPIDRTIIPAKTVIKAVPSKVPWSRARDCTRRKALRRSDPVPAGIYVWAYNISDGPYRNLVGPN